MGLTEHQRVAHQHGLAEELRQPLVQPDGQVVAESTEGELVKALVLEHVFDAILGEMLDPQRQALRAAADQLKR